MGPATGIAMAGPIFYDLRYIYFVFPVWFSDESQTRETARGGDNVIYFRG